MPDYTTMTTQEAVKHVMGFSYPTFPLLTDVINGQKAPLLQALLGVPEPDFTKGEYDSYLKCVNCGGNNAHFPSCWYFPIQEILKGELHA